MSQSVLATSATEPPIVNDWTLRFRQRLTREASDYWNAQRGARDMPAPEDLAVRGMKAFLSHVGIVDARATPAGGWDFAVRLAGEDIKKVFGNIVSKPLDRFLTPEGERRWRYSFEAVCARKARVRNYGSVAFEGMEWLDFEAMVAPLGEAGTITKLFVVFVAWPRVERPA
jgi:hypothetical protein